MAVYDKELIINGEAVRSPEQQVYKNMKDIQALKAKIKDVYSTDVTTLTSSSVSVATANVDGLGTATEGWLLDPNGLLFKITANDGTTTTLQYYADLKGPQGEDGAAVNIDDTGTAVDKCWSSQKTNNQIDTEVAKAKDKGIYYTKTQPTVVGTNLYYLDFENNILNINTNIPILEKDLLLYIDGDDKVIELYRVAGTNSLTKLADFGGGKQLYQHNIYIKSNDKCGITLTIVSDKSSAYDLTSLLLYLNMYGFSFGSNKMLNVSGLVKDSANYYQALGLQYNGTTDLKVIYTTAINSNSNVTVSSVTTFEDKVISI